MSTFPALHAFEPDAPVGWRDGRPVTAARFCAAALELAARLPRKRHVLNLCEDRLNFMLGFVAALSAGRTSLLPPSRAAGVVREIAASYPGTFCIADHNELPAGVPAMIVPPWPGKDAVEAPEIPAGQLAAILFTSGSTGEPKPHAKTWGSLVAAARGLVCQLGIGQACSMLGTVPPQHMYGLETTIMLPLQNGMAVHSGRPLLPADVSAALAAMTGSRWLAATPLHLRACMAEKTAVAAPAGVLCATMPLEADLAREVEERWAAPLHEIYGCTEAGTVALRRPAQTRDWRLCDGLRAWQESGATWISGGHLDQALKLPDDVELLDAERFILLGRPGDMVKVAGKRASIEALNLELLRIPGVRDGVFFLPEAQEGEQSRLAALAVAPGLDRAAILRALRERIDPAFLPRPLLIVEALPRNDTGKLAREGLLALARDAIAREPRRA
jgi:acyl-coenzyme A synthetase/AMP-(fatty) acid ligase